MKKIKTIFLISLLISSSVMIIVNNEVDVVASGGGGEGENESGWLDYDFMMEITEEFSNVIHNESIWNGKIPRGRTWGTDGDRWTANYTYKKMEKECGLTDVKQLPIGPIDKEGEGYTEEDYSSKIEVQDFQITINHPNYPYENPIPTSEIFPIPRATDLETEYYEYEYVRIIEVPNPNEYRPETWPFAGTYNNYSLNLTQEGSDFDLIIGNISYINISSNETVPEDHEGKVFLIDDVEGETQSRIDNMTNASGCIIIRDNTIGPGYSDTSNCTFSIANITENDDNQDNLTQIKNLLEGNETIIVDNYLKNGYLTFTYNLEDCPGLPGLPLQWFIFRKISKNEDSEDYYEDWAWVTGRARWLYDNDRKRVEGFFLYDSYETHFMTNPYFDKNGEGVPALPIFSVGYSVGNWLLTHQCTTTISGYLEQKYIEQTETDPGIVSYNVVGYRNITHSPDDSIVVISNRYDGGFWGEAAGDCALGGGVVLSIAKYFEDNDITPRYNLTFLMDTGEEYGRAGARHFRDSHPLYYKNKCIRWIGADQLGFNQAGTKLGVIWSQKSTRDIVWAIANTSKYYEKSNYNFEGWPKHPDYSYSKGMYGSDGGIWRDAGADVICFAKDTDTVWNMYQRSGDDYTEGDVFKNLDREDANASLDLFWNVTKYYTVYTDCWLNNVNFEVFDSPNDGDTLNDSIRANFTIKSILPRDVVVLNITLNTSEQVASYTEENITVNSSGVKKSISFSIPDSDVEGNYSLIIRLYNSTARINNLVSISPSGSNYTSSSSVYHLYHPFGYIKIGSSYITIEDNINGSVFTANEYGYADNITAYINKAYMSPGPYKCMLYRDNDSKLMGTTTENWTDRDEGDPVSSLGWAVFNFSEPKPFLEQGTEYVITCWGNNSYSRLYYDDFTSSRGRYNQTTYQVNPPDPISFTSENRLYSIYCGYSPENITPEISSVDCSPNPVGYGGSVTITAEVTDLSGINKAEVRIYRPEDEGIPLVYTMSNTEGDTYEYVFNDTWQHGQYNNSIWAEDIYGNSNTSSWYSFNLSAQATVSVCTVQDEYGNNTFVNITDPPSSSPPQVGYELLDNGEVLRIWNRLDSYYFDTNSGIQLTNHYDEYWSHNVLMFGYYSNDEWNLIYRTDALSGFNKDITTGEGFVNATLWKDLTYGGYDFRLAIRYHLGADDNELTVIPYIKNLGQEIPYVLGFAWEMKDIQIDMTPGGDYIEINGTTYLLNQSLDETYKDMDDPCFYLKEDFAGDRSESLYLRWDNDLDYKVKVESRNEQYNAPVTLGIKIGTLDVGQEKYTSLFWYDASEIIYYFNSYDNNEAWATSPSYMVDGSTSNYASTTISGDVELCDGNNCSGCNLGDISKVELRVYGYYVTNQYDIILRPVFGGTSDGLDYNHPTDPSPGWSRWFDITYDPGRDFSQWSWDEVKDLDCDVEAEDNMFPPPFLYAAKVEIRVTYTPNNDPVSGNPVPADGSTGITIAPVLNITVFDGDGDSMNITWYSNSSESWVAFGTNNSVGNGTYHQTFSNASVNGQWWYWKVNVTDGTDSVESSIFSFYTGYESKIKNTGSTNFSGYLLMQIQFYDTVLEDWFLVIEPVNEASPRTISIGGELGLDTIFNGRVETQVLLAERGNGTYRVYACFRDPDGDVLVCDDETLMTDSYEFTVSDS